MRTGVAIKVEMEIGSNEAIKQNCGRLRGISIVPACLALEGTKGPLTILDVEGFPIQCHYVVYPASKQLSVVANTFLEYLLLKVGTLLDR